MKTTKKSKKKKQVKRNKYTELKPTGRKTKLVPATVENLKSIFKIGGTVEEACAYAKIDKQTYYNWLEKSESFSTEIEQAKHYSDIAAKNLVVDKIIKDKDDTNARWWLEKRQFKDTNTPSMQFNQFNFGDASQSLQEKFMSFLKSNPQVTVEK